MSKPRVPNGNVGGRSARGRGSVLAALLMACSVWGGASIAPAAAQEGTTGGASAEPSRSSAVHGYLAEIVDSLFYVGPAEFLELVLPADPPGYRPVHLFGTISVADRKGDIMVRIFREPEFKNWLKKRGGDKSGPYWTSKRSRTLTLDEDLPRDVRAVVVLDNGYSVRTPKRVRTQLQIQYARTDGSVSPAAPAAASATLEDREEDFITPRANTEEDIPPPPPPPAEDGSK